MSLLQTLNTRYNIAKSYTKKFHDEVKRNIDDYDAATPMNSKTGKKDSVYNRHVASSRYDMTIPYIFATHESMTSGFFDNMPDIVITGRTAAEEKVEILKAMYAYIIDVADLDEFLSTSAWWFFLVGFVKANVEYKTEISHYVPQLDMNGEPMMGEDGQPVEVPVYGYDNPIATVDNPLKVYFSPESEFSIDAKKVPYYVTERLVDVDEIKAVYNIEVDPDQQLDVDDVSKEDEKSDLMRAKVMHYYGTLSSKDKDDLKEKKLTWAFDQNYKIYFTKEKILLAEEVSEKPCKLARCYTNQVKFFGFGLGKTLRPFQEDMSIRRSQQLAYADRFAYPWLVVPNGLKVDQKNLMDYEKKVPLTASFENGSKPEYLVPPPMPAIVAEADAAVRSDAQFVSGTLDLSKGAQNTNTVKTATGQQLFAQSQDKRLNKARKALAKYYREVVIQMFKLSRDNWNEDKQITYTNDEGESQEMTITKEDLDSIDFDTDIDFNLDSVSVNKDTESQRWLSLLETSAQLPFANQEKIYAKVLKESFRIQNPETYIKDPAEQQPEEMTQDMGAETGMNGQEVPMNPNEEAPSMDQTLGSQMAPESPYVG